MLSTWHSFAPDYSPAEVEKVTGMATGLQRVWRRRGYLPSTDAARARFDLFSVAWIMLRYTLANRGMPPRETEALGANYSRIVVFWALAEVHGSCLVIGPRSDVREFERAYHFNWTMVANLAGVDRNEVRKFIVKSRGLALELTDNPAEIFDNEDVESGFVVNLRVLGKHLGERTGRPLVHVEFNQVDRKNTDEIARRLLPMRAAKRN